MKRQSRMNEFVSFGSSKASGNCEPGSLEFSVAILKLSAMKGIPGFAHFEHDAESIYSNVTMSIAHVETLMIEARSMRPTPPQRCTHDCYEDCYTCQGGEHNHDCMVYREYVRSLIGETRGAWICSHYDSCECCICETDEEREDCTCCEHDCPSDCATCENHSQGEHDCGGRRYCDHDCHDAECFENEDIDLEEQDELYQILLNYESVEWPRAKAFSVQMARFHNMHLSSEQSSWLLENFRFADRWYDPAYRFENIMRTDGNPTIPASSNMPRLISNLNESMNPRNIQTLQHGFVMADSEARQRAMTFLLTGQYFGYLTREQPLITYSLRSTVRNIALVESLVSTDYDRKTDAINSRLASDTYARNASNVLWTIGQYHVTHMSEWLANFAFEIDNAHAIAPGVESQSIVNTYRTHMTMYVGTVLDEASRTHRLLNALVALRTPQPTIYPFVFMVEWLIANLHPSDLLEANTMRDIPSLLASEKFKLDFKAFCGIDRPRDSFTQQCDMLLAMDPRHANKVNNMIAARLEATNNILG